jgi:hypothetical protein
MSVCGEAVLVTGPILFTKQVYTVQCAPESLLEYAKNITVLPGPADLSFTYKCSYYSRLPEMHFNVSCKRVKGTSHHAK